MTIYETKRLMLDEWRRLRSEHAELLGVSIRVSKRMTRTLGSCRFRRVGTGHGCVSMPFEVVISHSLLTCGTEQVFDTLRHEAAHALAGLKAGHGPEWQAMAVRLGARPKTCGDLSLAQQAARAEVTKPRFTIRCARCGIEDTRHRVTKQRRWQYDVGALRHGGSCGGVLTLHDDRS